MRNGEIVSAGPLPEWVKAEFEPEFNVTAIETFQAEEVFKALNHEVVGLIGRGPTFLDGKLMDGAPNLKVIGRSGVGYDTVDIQAATQRGIPVVYTPGAMSRAVAEHTVALILAAAKNLHGWHHRVLHNEWQQRYGDPALDLEGATVGFVGFGRIGREVWHLLRPFDMRVLVYDPFIDSSRLPSTELRLVPLDELLKNSDIVTLHAPLGETTKHLVNAQSIEKFKQGAILVNTARGGLMENHDILYRALESGRLSYLALDVFVAEPPDLTHPLFKHPRALFTAHVAANTSGAQRRIMMSMIEDMKAVLEGRRPRLENVVNPDVLAGPSKQSEIQPLK